MTLADAQETAFNVGSERRVIERLGDVIGNFSRQLEGQVSFAQRSRFYRTHYHDKSEGEFLMLARKYEVDFLILEKPHVLSLPQVFENAGFTVYRVLGPTLKESSAKQGELP
ncbi:MAG TPA: hypothetical protein VLU25_09390 [Acidobacteriota bacterium]|nr:hypothetical protein [Acidobacteriota bacterium]